jgi:hypothetical protein
MTKILYCSWCDNNTFLPISAKLVKCDTCGQIKALDVEDHINVKED